jgi:regulator of cell morphogenesis and NO signaling
MENGTQKILPETKLAGIIEKNEYLILVLHRFGIRLGVGDKSVKAICIEAGMQPDLLVCVINTLTDPHYNPTETLQTFSVLQLIDYLKKENAYFLKQLEMIGAHIRMFVGKSDVRNSNLYLLDKIFQEYKQEIQAFIQQKETVLFPTVIRVYEEYYSPVSEKKQRKDPVTFPDDEAMAVKEKLSDIKSLIIKHITGEYEENMLYSVLMFLQRLEKETDNQSLIENCLLKSIVRKMEEDIFKAQKGKHKKVNYNTHISISSPKKELLSLREIEVLRLVSKGYINKEIAEELQISLHTVISHRKNIAEKLSIKTISGLTVYAMMNGII